MFVCVDDDGPRLVGWTSLEPSRERPLNPWDGIRFAVPEPVPFEGIVSPTVTMHEFATRMVYRGIHSERVIMLSEGDDPAVLPGWEPREENILRVFVRTDDGSFLPLAQVTPAELERMTLPTPSRPPVIAAPRFWCAQPRADRGCVVYPLLPEGYELVIERGRSFLATPPRQRNLPGDLLRPRTFVGIDPARGPDRTAIHHINGDRRDNRPENLSFGGIPFVMDDRVPPDELRVVGFDQYGSRIVQQVPLTDRADAMRLAIHELMGRRDAEMYRTLANPPGGEYLAQMQGLGQQSRMQQAIALAQLGQQQSLAVNWDALMQRIGATMGIDYAMFGRPRIDPETAAAARERSRGLLKSLLTPAQWAEFEVAGIVTEQIDGCEFRLRPGGMIEAHKPRRVPERWCVSPESDDWLPDEDKLIGQLLHLRAGPDKLRAQANVFAGGASYQFGFRNPRAAWS